MAEKSYVCGYKHCLHKGEKVLESEAIVVNKKRYHKDCLQISETIKLIKDTYIEKINDKENPVVILSVVNNLVFKKGVDADFLLFALEDIARRKVDVKSPYTMHYFDKNMILKEKWRTRNDADRQWLN